MMLGDAETPNDAVGVDEYLRQSYFSCKPTPEFTRLKKYHSGTPKLRISVFAGKTAVKVVPTYLNRSEQTTSSGVGRNDLLTDPPKRGSEKGGRISQGTLVEAGGIIVNRVFCVSGPGPRCAMPGSSA
jgi:hypothetical protein